MYPQAREAKSKSKQTGQHQTKEFLQAKETINKMKKTPTDWERYLQNINKKGLISKTQLNIKKKYKSSTGTLKDIQHY